MTVIMVSDKNKSTDKNSTMEDPFDELNEIEDKTVTIERENDVFEELEIRDAESIPEYNPESGSFIQTDEGLEKYVKGDLSDGINSNLEKTNEGADAVKIMDVIDDVDINNPDNVDKLDTKRIDHEVINASEQSDKIAEKSEELSKVTEKSMSVKEDNATEAKKDKSDSKPKVRVKPNLANRNKKSDTKVVDNVKVDEDGVPLLNQFDTDTFKNTAFYHKLHLNKRNLTQIALILVGFVIIIYGIIEAFNEVARISDNVMYGEHASLSVGIIFFGIIIIILAFYREIINLLGLGNMHNTIDLDDSKKSIDDDLKDKKK